MLERVEDAAFTPRANPVVAIWVISSITRSEEFWNGYERVHTRTKSCTHQSPGRRAGMLFALRPGPRLYAGARVYPRSRGCTDGVHSLHGVWVRSIPALAGVPEAASSAAPSGAGVPVTWRAGRCLPRLYLPRLHCQPEPARLLVKERLLAWPGAHPLPLALRCWACRSSA